MAEAVVVMCATYRRRWERQAALTSAQLFARRISAGTARRRGMPIESVPLPCRCSRPLLRQLVPRQWRAGGYAGEHEFPVLHAALRGFGAEKIHRLERAYLLGDCQGQELRRRD